MPATHTLAVLLADLQNRMDEYLIESLTADASSSTTVIRDSVLVSPYDDDDFIDWWAYIDTDAGGSNAAPETEERRIIDFDGTTNGDLTVFPAFTAAVASGDTYSLRAKIPRYHYVEAINDAIKNVDSIYPHIASDENIIIRTDILDYALNSRVQHVYQMYIEEAATGDSGTATGGSSTTLDDTSQSWSADEWNDNYAARIYDGAGAGQYATITDTTTTRLTVASWNTYNSAAVVNPTTTSLYKIVRLDQELEWTPVTSVKFDYAAQEFRLRGGGLTEGYMLRIVYARDHTELVGTTTTTQAPIGYVRPKALSYLWGRQGRREDARDTAIDFEQLYHDRGEEYITRNPFRHPPQMRFGGVSGAHGWNSYLSTPTGPVFRQHYDRWFS